MTDEVIVAIPDPNDWKMDKQEYALFQFSQELLRSAIAARGVEIGVSMVLSGITREMRRHLSDAMAKQILQGFVDTMEDIRKYDKE